MSRPMHWTAFSWDQTTRPTSISQPYSRNYSHSMPCCPTT